MLVALGGGHHVRRVAQQLVLAIRRCTTDVSISVAAGFSRGRRPTLRGARWLSARTGLTQALVDCDVAIVAGGVTLYEACALGTPAVALAVVPEQRRGDCGVCVARRRHRCRHRVRHGDRTCGARRGAAARRRTAPADHRVARAPAGRRVGRAARGRTHPGDARPRSATHCVTAAPSCSTSTTRCIRIARSCAADFARSQADWPRSGGCRPAARAAGPASSAGQRRARTRVAGALCSFRAPRVAGRVARRPDPRAHAVACACRGDRRRCSGHSGRTGGSACLTNGEPHVQRRKVAALGLGDLVDAVVFAAECGDGTGKPAPSAFRAALDRLNVEPARAVFVGDDPRTDIEGAAAVGMKTIHMMNHFGQDERCGGARLPDSRAASGSDPAIAEQLVPLRMESHVA